MKMIIPAAKRALLQALSEHIDTHYVDSVVTLITRKAERMVTLVCGQSPFCSEYTLHLDDRSSELKDKQFSIDGSFAKRLIHYFAEEQDIELRFDSTTSGTLFVELIDTTELGKGDDYQTPALRRCQCGDASDEHLAYLADNQQRPTATTSKAAIERIVFEAQENVPFEFLELNKEEQYLRVQRQGEVEDKSLPQGLTLPVSLVLTPETTKQMTELCRITSGNEIEIAQQGETVTFKAPECTLTCSIAGVEAFYQKKPDPVRSLKYVALNLFAFKKELEHCFKHYGRIKKANDALLYLGEDRAAIAVLTPPYEFVHPIHVFEVGQHTPYAGSLFRFSPRDLDNIKIKNSLEAKKTRLDVFETSRGELKLGVYYSLDERLPYDTIAIENDERHLNKVLSMMERIDAGQEDAVKAPEQQGDLFSFADEL